MTSPRAVRCKQEYADGPGSSSADHGQVSPSSNENRRVMRSRPLWLAGLLNISAALEKRRLNDSSFGYEPETSAALGFGFRCGFLGFLHAEIVQERLEREYNLDLITTAPTVRYKVVPRDGEPFEIESPSALPETQDITQIEEPVVLATIHVPSEHLGAVLGLCQDRRGVQKDMGVHGTRVQVRYELPLNEIVTDFHDKLKSLPSELSEDQKNQSSLCHNYILHDWKK